MYYALEIMYVIYALYLLVMIYAYKYLLIYVLVPTVNESACEPNELACELEF